MRLMVAIVVAAVLVLVGSSTATAAKAGQGKAPDPTALVEKRTTNLNRILAKARTRLIELSHLPSVQSQNAKACSADMAALPPMSRYGSSGATDIQGNLYCLGIPLTSPVNIADRAYFLRAIGTRDLGVGDYQLGRVTGLGSIGLGYPVIVNRQVTGIVLTVLSLDWLEKRALHKLPPGALDVLVIDDHGTVLARAGVRPTRPGTNIGGNALVEAMISEPQGEGNFRLGKKPVRSAFDTVPLSDGNMHVAISVKRR
jgi:hypothetical protein